MKTASELFGGPEVLAARIYETSLAPRSSESDGAAALKAVGQWSRQQLLERLDRDGTTLASVMRLNMNDADRDYWLKQMRLNAMVASGGADPDEDVALEVFVRLEALNEVCRKEDSTIMSSERRSELRNKYKNFQ